MQRHDEQRHDGDDPDELVLPLSAEVLTVSKRVTGERVSVRRETRTREATVDELLTDETVVVERVPIGRYVDAVPAVREEGDCTILPVVEEVAVVVRRLLLREEVWLRRVRTSRHHVETVTLREQQAVIARAPLDVAADSVPFREPGPVSQTPFAINASRRMPVSEETIVAVFDTVAHADAAVADLKTARVPESAITRHASEASGATGATVGTTPGSARDEGFWSSLFGGTTTDEQVYDHSVTTGGSVVVVKTPTEQADSVATILERHSPIDLDERAGSYGYSTQAAGTSAGMAATATTATSSYAAGTSATDRVGTTAGTEAEGGVLRLSEESLAVGKRLVNRGGTRIRRYVVEHAAEADVTLRTESIQVERRPVTDATASTADFTDKTIEMTATAEEAVVGKTSRVVEEVSLRKEASDRTETVRDTVRRQEVEVEQVPGTETTTTDTTAIPPANRTTPR